MEGRRLLLPPGVSSLVVCVGYTTETWILNSQQMSLTIPRGGHTCAALYELVQTEPALVNEYALIGNGRESFGLEVCRAHLVVPQSEIHRFYFC
jgi:hypothetical protein